MPSQPELPALAFDQWLTPKEVGAIFGVDGDTFLIWWHCGLPDGLGDIPLHYMRPRGFRNYLFHPAVIDFIRAAQARKFDLIISVPIATATRA